MEIILGIEQIKKPFLNPVVTLGNFDGVHLGHQKIFERVKEEAKRYQGEAVVVTFEPHPLKVLAPQRFLPLLTPFRKKVMLIQESGIDAVLCLGFSKTFSEMPPSEFIENILLKGVRPRKVIIGYNYHFGKGQRGDAHMLIHEGKRFGFEVEVVEALRIGQTTVSSSKIRELIQEGKVEEAAALLGRGYLIIGSVVVGAKRGRTLGFPTANLEISDELYPRAGVYAVEVLWNDQRFHGVANVGWNPTFQGSNENPGAFSLEIHLLDFHQELYGQEIQVRFKRRIRDEIRFDSAERLIDQIQKDIQWAQENAFRP